MSSEHTYLRYECADAFGLTVTTGMAPANEEDRVLTMAGSHVLGWNLKTCQLEFKVGPVDTSTNVGTGQALTPEHMTSLVSSETIMATGWNSGSIRVFDAIEEGDRQRTLAHSLLNGNGSGLSDPRTVFHGHSTALQALALDNNSSPSPSAKLASGCGKGTVVVWDLVSETGLFRLLGHKGGITSLEFALDGKYLMSTSLDGLAKAWDLEGQYCIQTFMMSGQTQIWSSALWNSKSVIEEEQRHRFFTGGVNGQVLVWKVEQPRRKQGGTGETTDESNERALDSEENDDGTLDRLCHCMGPLPIDATNTAMNQERIIAIRHCAQRWIGVLHHQSKSILIYKIRSIRESQRKRQRRLRRRREKQQQKQDKTEETKGRKRGLLDDDDDDDDEGGGEEADNDDDDVMRTSSSVEFDAIKASDEFEYYGIVRASHKIKDFLLLGQKQTKRSTVIKVVCALSTNAMEVHTLNATEKDPAVSEKQVTIDMYGHPTGIRSMALSSDHTLCCTVSKHVSKVWNVARRSCLLSITPATTSNNNCYGLCVAFLPGNTHVVLGTREGSVLILDIQGGTVVHEESKAHEGAVWGLDVYRHQHESSVSITLVTGSADKSVKFWDLEESEEGGHPILVHTRTLEMSDEVVAVKYSSQSSTSKTLVFVSTLDSTIKVLFEDSLKLFLSLYGHSLPALCVSPSDDNALLASGGADKTIKVWGLDFGDTHCTLHGHSDSVTDLAFIRRTHCFVSSSKDGSVRYWDADRFQCILVLEGHSAEVNCVAVTNGAFVLSGGMDRQVRVWERTRDIVFVEEERERVMEQQFDAQLIANEDDKGTLSVLNEKQKRENDEEDNEVEEKPQSEAAVKKSVLSVSSGDRIMEGLERADEELSEIARYKKDIEPKKRQNNPLLLGLDPAQYVMWVLKTIPSAELEQSILILSLKHIERLFYYLIVNLKRGRGVELSCRIAIFIVATHQRQIVATTSLLTPLRELRRLIRLRLTESRDQIGFNLAALRLVANIHKENKTILSADEPQDIWAGLGLGSDVAAALQSRRPN